MTLDRPRLGSAPFWFWSPYATGIIAMALLSSCSVKSPPARYDHPYTGALEVRHVPRQVAEDICPFSRGATGWGCAFPRGSSCLIILVEGASPEVLRHEVAHCNGWPGDHSP